MADNSISDFQVTAIPMLSVHEAAKAIAFYKKAFAAQETERITDDAGKVAHAKIKIGEASLMLSDEFPEIGILSPQTLGGSPVMILLEVADVDRVFAQALDAGAVCVRPVTGETLRNGKLTDPFGHRWMILTRNVAAETP